MKVTKNKTLNFISVGEISSTKRSIFLNKICLAEKNHKVLKYYNKKEGMFTHPLFLIIIIKLFIAIISYDTLLDDQNESELNIVL